MSRNAEDAGDVTGGRGPYSQSPPNMPPNGPSRLVPSSLRVPAAAIMREIYATRASTRRYQAMMAASQALCRACNGSGSIGTNGSGKAVSSPVRR